MTQSRIHLPQASAPPVEPEETPYRTHRRFDRAARLFSEPGLHALMGARVIIFGMGGVGSFALEALARSAVGHLTLVDFDDICVTNHNRQLHALKGEIGKAKVEVMAERARRIHPTATIEPIATFYRAETSDELLSGEITYVVDAIDNLTAKAHLIATCIRRGLPLVSSMGAAARLDPTRIKVADLAHTRGDPMARAVRKILKREYGIAATSGEPIGVQAVYTDEPPTAPSPVSYDEGQGFRCVCPNGKNGLHTCDRRSRIDGSAGFVTGAFGLTCASVVVRELTAPHR
ncbi:MAG: tRNA threonylcarbamoyladenosine dehydratase [Myxococcota bacterium]